MKPRRLILSGLTFYWRTHLGTFGAAAIATAVIVAALGVGDSVRASLERIAGARLGRVGFAAHARDRTWREDLASSLSKRLDAPVSAALLLNASVARPDGTARIAGARVAGVDEAFWTLSPGGRPPVSPWPADGVAVSFSIAVRLGLEVGDRVAIRVERPAVVPRDASLASGSDAVAALLVEVVAVCDADSFGAFALEIGQVAPANVFLPLRRLQEAVGEVGRANTLLVGGGDEARIAEAIRESFTFGDAGLALRSLDGGRGWQLGSRRVFLEPAAGRAALAQPGAFGVLTWFVNDIAAGGRHTPYSMVAALPRKHPLIPGDLAAGEILVNTWLAGDLGAGPGDVVAMTYFVPGSGGTLSERTSEFRIRAVVPVEGDAADPELMPDFPGLSGSESCRDWDPGFPLDLARIRDVDEAWWDEHRGTPKAFLALDAGQGIWRSRFGDLTAVRFPPGADPVALELSIRGGLDPADFGLRFVDLAGADTAARAGGMDFGTLFLGFSAFLVAAALLLAGLVVALNISMRQEEMATLFALGFTARRVRRLIAAEHALVSLAGGLVGVAGGVALASGAIAALGTVWSDVAGSLAMTVTVRPATLLAGAAAGAAASSGAAWLVIRRAVRGSISDAFVRGEELSARIARTRAGRCVGAFVALAFAVGAAVTALASGTGRDPATAGAFFGSGALLLAAALSLTWYALAHVGAARPGRRPGGWGMAWRNLGRRRGRSLATAGVLAFGVFMFLGVTVFRRDRLTGSDDRASGTGGFALVGESAVAVVRDLDTAEGRKAFALLDADLEGVSVVGMRVRAGDDASCRSLTRAQSPPIVGVDPEALAGRFTFVKAEAASGSPWRLLAVERPDGSVPAVIDQAMSWNLGMGLGDEIELADEGGRPFSVRIAGVIDNAVLNGRLVVSERAFLLRFPSESGCRQFLIETPKGRADAVAALLTRQLEDRGLALERSEARLNALNAVENTYLGIFQALGGLGLLLGSAGLALVVGRNTIERRSEFALLGAVGFRKGRIVRLVGDEHAVLLCIGLGAGLLASALSLVPALLAPGARVATPAMGLVVLALGAGGMLWTRLAARLALRGPLLANLRGE